MESKELNKAVKNVHKQVDPVIEAIRHSIPESWTPQMTAAVFNLYMQMYE